MIAEKLGEGQSGGYNPNMDERLVTRESMGKLDAHIHQLYQPLDVPVQWINDPNESSTEWVDTVSHGRLNQMFERWENPAIVNTIRPDEKLWRLHLPFIISHYAYAAALHELGHAIANTSSEIGAWRWAYKNALVWTDEMTASARHGLQSYVWQYGLSQDSVDRTLMGFANKGEI